MEAKAPPAPDDARGGEDHVRGRKEASAGGVHTPAAPERVLPPLKHVNMEY